LFEVKKLKWPNYLVTYITRLRTKRTMYAAAFLGTIAANIFFRRILKTFWRLQNAKIWMGIIANGITLKFEIDTQSFNSSIFFFLVFKLTAMSALPFSRSGTLNWFQNANKRLKYITIYSKLIEKCFLHLKLWLLGI
jgi:hypothetical protein